MAALPSSAPSSTRPGFPPLLPAPARALPLPQSCPGGKVFRFPGFGASALVLDEGRGGVVRPPLRGGGAVRASREREAAGPPPAGRDDVADDRLAPASRRQVLGGVAGAGLSLLTTFFPENFDIVSDLGTPSSHSSAHSSSHVFFLSGGGTALAAKDVTVGSYLPPADVDNFVVFTAGPKDTPALRAGNVNPYKFFVPPTWVQQRIANILSGNYCQPKCAEPWIEVKFEDPRQGTLQVVASPMVRLTNKLNASIDEIGDPERIISALGPFVTGDSYDPDEVTETSIEKVDGQTFYKYALETPYARSGAHNLAIATAKGSTVLLLVISANDSQWATSQPVLRKLRDSFRVL